MGDWPAFATGCLKHSARSDNKADRGSAQRICAQESRMQEEQELSKKHKGLQAKQLERLHQAAEAASIDLGPGWTAEVKVRQQGSTAGIARCSIPLSWPANTHRRRRAKAADCAADAWVPEMSLMHVIVASRHA